MSPNYVRDKEPHRTGRPSRYVLKRGTHSSSRFTRSFETFSVVSTHAAAANGAIRRITPAGIDHGCGAPIDSARQRINTLAETASSSTML